MYEIAITNKVKTISELNDIATEIIEEYIKEKRKYKDLSIGDYLSCLEISGLTMEAIVILWSLCLNRVEGDTIIQFFNESPDLSEFKNKSYWIIGE